MKQYFPAAGVAKFSRLFGKTRQVFYDHNWRNNNEQSHEAFIIDKSRPVRQHTPGIGAIAAVCKDIDIYNRLRPHIRHK